MKACSVKPLWAGLAGAAKYLACRKRAGAEQLAVCRTCETATVNYHKTFGLYSLFCGKPLEAIDKTSCGCLLGTMRASDVPHGRLPEEVRRIVRLNVIPAGKATCNGQRCPQGKW